MLMCWKSTETNKWTNNYKCQPMLNIHTTQVRSASNKKRMNTSWRYLLPAGGTIPATSRTTEDTAETFLTEHVATRGSHYLASCGFHFTERIQTNRTVSTRRCVSSIAAASLTTIHRLLWPRLGSEFERYRWKIIVRNTSITDDIWRTQVVVVPCRRCSSRCTRDDNRAAIKICQIDKLLFVVIVIACQINKLWLRTTCTTGCGNGLSASMTSTTS